MIRIPLNSFCPEIGLDRVKTKYNVKGKCIQFPLNLKIANKATIDKFRQHWSFSFNRWSQSRKATVWQLAKPHKEGLEAGTPLWIPAPKSPLGTHPGLSPVADGCLGRWGGSFWGSDVRASASNSPRLHLLVLMLQAAVSLLWLSSQTEVLPATPSPAPCLFTHGLISLCNYIVFTCLLSAFPARP